MEIGKRYNVVYHAGRYEIEYENSVKCINITPKKYRIERMNGKKGFIEKDSIIELKETTEPANENNY